MTTTGRCRCGAVRYELTSAPGNAGWCHCRTCQLTSGAPAMAFASVPIGDYRIITGVNLVRETRSSSFGRRRFCAACGTPLSMQVDFQPEQIDFPITTLDEPGDVAPEFHIFTGSRVLWFYTKDNLPRHERYRPDTTGLTGTEPPGG